jgi:tetratricopeptide (TPR) repeat protein
VAETGAELFLLEAWVADNPGSRMFLRLARAYHEQDRLDEAAEVLQRGLVMHPGMVEARHLLARVLQAKGDTAEAATQLTAAARELSRHAGVFADLAALWEQEGREPEAASARRLAEALGRGLELDEGPGVETATLAEIYAAQGHTAEAAAIYRRLMADEPEEPPADQPARPEAAGAAGADARDRARSRMLGRLEGLRSAAQKRASRG